MFLSLDRVGVRRGCALVLLSFMGVLFSGNAAQALPLLISEVFYDAESSDDGQVFVELAGDPGLSLDGLRLDDDGLGVRGGGAGLVVEQVQLDHLRSLRRAVGARHRLFGREAVKAGAEGRNS